MREGQMVQESTWFAVGSGGVRFGMHAGKVGPACMAVMARQQGHRQAKQGPCSSPHVMVFRYHPGSAVCQQTASCHSAQPPLSCLCCAAWQGCLVGGPWPNHPGATAAAEQARGNVSCGRLRGAARQGRRGGAGQGEQPTQCAREAGVVIQRHLRSSWLHVEQREAAVSRATAGQPSASPPRCPVLGQRCNGENTADKCRPLGVIPPTSFP